MTKSSTGRCASAVVAAGVLLGICAGAGPPELRAQSDRPPVSSVEVVNRAMAAAASALLASLSGERLRQASLEFEDSARTRWEFIPTYREGVPLADLTAEQRILAHELLRTAMSGQGYLKVITVMHLDEILRQFDTSGFARSGENYMVAIFGDPSGNDPWGWRFEGHHISLNFTSTAASDLSTTPLFLGANPAEVRGGLWTGVRALADEEDLGWRLISSLSAEQRTKAVIAEEAPTDILTRNDPVARDLPELGLPASEMTAAQRSLLLAVIESYARNVEEPVAEARLTAMRNAGFDALRFAWAGSTEAGSPYYYRITGPTILIELDNVQGGGNHVHSVWRDRTGDFGGDALRRHYEAAH